MAGTHSEDERFMHEALAEGPKGLGSTSPNPPVGAVVVRDGEVIGRGWHERAGEAHAERRAFADAIKHHGVGAARGATLYVTLEPCVMCAGAIMHARVGRVVFGASDPKTGACGSIIDLPAETRLNHHLQVEAGMMATEASTLLKQFFAQRRKASEQNNHEN